MSDQDQDDLMIDALAQAKLLAAEREHEIKKLQKKIELYETQDEKDDQEEEGANEFKMWSQGNEAIEQGNVVEAVENFTAAMKALYTRYIDYKTKSRAQRIVNEEVKAKWIDAKEAEMATKESLLNEEKDAIVREYEDKIQEKESAFEKQKEEWIKKRITTFRRAGVKTKSI